MLTPETTDNPEILSKKFINAVTQYMEKYKISEGVCAVTKDSLLLANFGIGTDKDTLFRIASLTKPITRAAIEKLKTENKIDDETKVFPLLGLKPLPGKNYNPNLDQITIRQLIDHQGGWDASLVGEITFMRPKIAKAVGKNELDVTPEDCVRYMLSQPLQFQPGEKRSYSGFGYVVLGRVIEKVTGKNYYDYLETQLFGPLDLHSFSPAHTRKENSLPKEAHYEKDSSGENPHEDPYWDVPFEMDDSAGGLVANALDLNKFINNYNYDGTKSGHEKKYYYANGRCCGTLGFAIWRPDGINIVALFNNRYNRDNNKDIEFVDLMNRTANDLRE